MLFFNGEELLAPRPTAKMEDNLLSAVRDCLFSTFATTLRIWRLSPRRLHKEEPRNLYAAPNIIRVSKSRRMKLAEHVARMGGFRNAYKILVGKPWREETTRKT